MMVGSIIINTNVMSRITVVAEATAKMLEIERIRNSRGYKANGYGVGRISSLLQELTALRYSNAMCGEKSLQDWLLKLCRECGVKFS